MRKMRRCRLQLPMMSRRHHKNAMRHVRSYSQNTLVRNCACEEKPDLIATLNDKRSTTADYDKALGGCKGDWTRRPTVVRAGRDLLKDSFNKNLYDYVHNQAIHFTDQRGLRLFCCPKGYSAADEAARNAIATWNPTSIRENREHGGYVCGCRAWFGLSKVVYTTTLTL